MTPAKALEPASRLVAGDHVLLWPHRRPCHGHGGARVAREELDEAPSVAMAMNAGATLAYATRALDCFAETSLPEPPAA